MLTLILHRVLQVTNPRTGEAVLWMHSHAKYSQKNEDRDYRHYFYTVCWLGKYPARHTVIMVLNYMWVNARDIYVGGNYEVGLIKNVEKLYYIVKIFVVWEEHNLTSLKYKYYLYCKQDSCPITLDLLKVVHSVI